MAHAYYHQRTGILSLIDRVPPLALWCVVCLLAAFSAISSGGRWPMVLVLSMLAATPGVIGGAWSWLREQEPELFAGHVDVALWIIVTCGLISLSGGEASPLALIFVLPVLSSLARGEALAASAAGLSAIIGYIFTVVIVRQGIIGQVRDMDFLVMPLSLGALALVCLYVLRMADRLASADRGDGRTRLTPVCPEPGEPVYHEAMAHCVAERNEAMRRVGLAERKEQERCARIKTNAVSFAQRMRFIADIGLEVRTPLDIMTGFSEEVAKSVVSDQGAQVAEYAAHIFRAGCLLRILIDNLEDIARISSGSYPLRREEVDIDDIAALTYRLLAERAREARVALVPTAKAGLVASADARAMRQIVLNLLNYCIVSVPGEGARAGLWARADGHHIQIGAHVTGHDESADSIARKSRPLRMPATNMPDSGLAVARAFAELHGGTLSSSVRADGRFGVWVLLPTVGETTPPYAAEDKQRAMPHSLHEKDRASVVCRQVDGADARLSGIDQNQALVEPISVAGDAIQFDGEILAPMPRSLLRK